jgi:hypothetical protein
MLLLALVGGGCAGFGGNDRPSARETPPSAPPSGELRVDGAREIDAPHVVGNRASGLPGSPHRLAGAVNSPFAGTMAPAAVSRLDAPRTFAYHAFLAGRPVLRRYDAQRRRDSVIARGAFSLAWRRDGAFAYFKGLRPKVGDPSRYLGHLVVREGRDRAVRWTSRPARYVAAAWAGDHLLAYRLSRVSADVMVFDGPRTARVLARDAFLVAISPDGLHAVTSRPGAGGATVALRDVATGIAHTDLTLRGGDAAKPDGPVTFVSTGSWSGERVVGATNLGLVVFRVERRRIALEQTLDVDLTRYPTGLQEPVLDSSGNEIVAWAELAAKPRQAVAEAALVQCDRLTLHCRQGRPAPGLQPPRPIHNPSRP